MFGFGKRQTRQATAEETRSLANPTELETLILGSVPSASGIVVTARNALAVPAVMAGVKAISEAVGGLPLHAYGRSADGSRERNTDHPAFLLLNRQTNPYSTGSQLRELMTADAIAYGNGYAQIVRDGAGEPRELHRLFPPAVAIEIDPATGEPTYKVTTGSQTRVIASKDILHIRAPSPLSVDAVTGRSPLIDAKDAIGLLIVLQRHANQLFANGGRPSGILSFPQKLGSEVAKRIKASWQAATTGGNAGGTAVLEEGGDFTPLSFNSVDNQFLEIWALSITEVARVLRVPPVLLMDYSRQTWANAETGGQQFLTYSLSPWLGRWEAEVTLKLISPDEQKTLFVEHLTDALLKSDFASRATAYSAYRAAGVLTANEVRAGLNMPKIDGGDILQNPYTTSDKTKPDTDPASDKKDDKTDA